MNNSVNSSPARCPEKTKFNLSQLDCVFSLHDLPEAALEEEKAEFLRTPLMECVDMGRPLSLNKLFQDEELYLGDPSSACLDSQTLPLLFRRSSQRSQKKKEGKTSPKGFHEEALKDLLCGDTKLPNLAAYVCQCAGLLPNYALTLPAYSPLSVFVSPTQGTPSKCTLTQILTEVLRYTFQNIHDAVVQGAECVPEMPPPEEVPMEDQSPAKRVESYDDFNQSVIMSDIDSTANIKRRHKAWSEAEERELIRVLQEAGTLKVPDEKWEELSKRFNRTVCSLHAKAKTLARKGLTWQVPAVPSKEEGRTYFDMIAAALDSVPEQKASKEDIISLICEKHGIGRTEIEKAVTQCLAKKFERCPGVYRLKDGIDIPPNKEVAKGSVKDRLIYILGTLLPYREGTLAQIRQKYQQEFKEALDTKTSANSNQAVWEKTVSKTLLKCAEFDKSYAKTNYTFKRALML